MDFRILGPLEVVDAGGALELGPSRRKALLAALLLHPREPVSPDRLVEALWGEGPPATAQKIVQVYVSELRKTLGRERIVTRSGGYAVEVAPEELDATRFERLAADGREALAGGDAAGAAELLGEALALWRGSALADFDYEPFAQTEIARLEELRLGAVEDRLEAELALGRADVAAIEALVAEHPLRERPRAQLMLALYRAGRQAEALGAYQDARRMLVDELGIEPGPALQRLERAILLQDPGLEAPSRTPRGGPAAAVGPETRRPVTAVFAAVEPAGDVDPELLGPAVAGALERAVALLGRHGAAVEARAAGELVGVFGLQAVHEDDAVRAVRAALELRDDLGSLEPPLRLRAAIGSGEAVAGAPGATAGLRPRAAPLPGEIVLEASTERLVRAAVRLEPAAEGVWRVTGLVDGAPAIARRPDTPLVGRHDELGRLLDSFERVRRTGSPALVTVLGPAGIGKSRLAAELRALVEDEAWVLTGRCLPYGEGITFWPLAEIVQQALAQSGAATVAELLGESEDAVLVAERVAGATGAGEAAAAGPETFWAVRRMLELLARRRPLIAVLDDLHWAEPTFLDLVESVADLARDAPLLTVCLARPELVDERPGWAGGKLNAISLLLDPLSEEESGTLIERLAPPDVAPGERLRVAAAAEGNPLFIEQLLAMLGEAGGGVSLPATLHALLAARLDRLPVPEREALQVASVMGKEFWAGAVAELAGPPLAEELADLLDALVRKDLLRPAPSSLPGQEAFRFRHQLIRDAAYASVPKRGRSELHERFAAWLERAAGARAREYEEILGYHLEQAALLRAELGSPDAGLASRAGATLAAAGRRAEVRGDMPAAATLLSRGVALLAASDPARLGLLPRLGDALRAVGDFDAAAVVIAEALAAEDERVAWHARIAELRLRLRTEAVPSTDDLLAEIEQAIAALGRLGDEQGLAEAWAVRAWTVWLRCRAEETEEAALRSIEHARRAGEEATAWRSLLVRLGTFLFGPAPVPDAIERCEQILAQTSSLIVTATALRALAGLEAMRGRFERARELVGRDLAILEELGLTVVAAHAAEVAALVELLAGDAAAAERRLRGAYETTLELGDVGAPTLGAMLARALEAQGRDDEALAVSEASERDAGPEDLTTQVQWRGPRARVLARRGEIEEAERLAREAVALAERTDFLSLHADALVDLAAVLAVRGEDAGAERAAAIELFELKGNVAGAERARREWRR